MAATSAFHHVPSQMILREKVQVGTEWACIILYSDVLPDTILQIQNPTYSPLLFFYLPFLFIKQLGPIITPPLFDADLFQEVNLSSNHLIFHNIKKFHMLPESCTLFRKAYHCINKSYNYAFCPVLSCGQTMIMLFGKLHTTNIYFACLFFSSHFNICFWVRNQHLRNTALWIYRLGKGPTHKNFVTSPVNFSNDTNTVKVNVLINKKDSHVVCKNLGLKHGFSSSSGPRVMALLFPPTLPLSVFAPGHFQLKRKFTAM